MFYEATFVWSHLSCSLTRSSANTHRFRGEPLWLSPKCLPTSLPSHAGQAHSRKQVSYPCRRLAHLQPHLIFLGQLEDVCSRKLSAQISCKDLDEFSQIQTWSGKAGTRLSYVQEAPQLCCFWFLWPAKAINVPSHRSMGQRLSSRTSIPVVSRDHEKVWGGLRVTEGMPSREVVKSSFLLSLSLSPCRRRVSAYSLRHKRAIMMIHHWPGTRANQMGWTI